MSSEFSGGATPDYFSYNGNRRLANMLLPTSSYPLLSYRSNLAAVSAADDLNPQMLRRGDLFGKRSLAEFEQLQLLQLQRRHVKQRVYQHASPISPLSPVVFSLDQMGCAAGGGGGVRYYGGCVSQQPRREFPIFDVSSSSSSFSSSSTATTTTTMAAMDDVAADTEKEMKSKLQELEKELFDDDNEEEVSAVTNSEWSETIRSLSNPTRKPISPLSPPSPSSSSSCSSSSVITACPKQSLLEAASAISEGKLDAASEILTRLTHASNAKGTPEQSMTAYVAAALRSRVNPTRYPPPVYELFSKEHIVSTQMLYEVSPCFKLGFMAANFAIMEAVTSSSLNKKLHVIDFDIGRGGQYAHLLHALAAMRKDNNYKKKQPEVVVLKITTFTDFINGGEEKLRVVGDELKSVAKRVGLSLVFNVVDFSSRDLCLEKLAVEEAGEVLAVNFAFRLFKLPDESVTTENLRDDLLRRVRRMSPAVVTVVEQEMNANTALFSARVIEACGYYGALLDSLDASMPRESPDRVRVEEGLGRKIANSVACEGRDRVERCEVYGKWRARMSMAGFEPRPIGQHVSDLLRSKLHAGRHHDPRFMLSAQNGSIRFGWMGRTLTVASAWH